MRKIVTAALAVLLAALCCTGPATASAATDQPADPVAGPTAGPTPAPDQQVIQVVIPPHPGASVAPPTSSAEPAGPTDDGNGDLPGTGGPRVGLALAGALLVVLGAYLVRRRRKDSADPGEGVLARSPDLG